MNNKTYLALALLVSLPLVASEQEKQEIDLKEHNEASMEQSHSFIELTTEYLSAEQHYEEIHEQWIIARRHVENTKKNFSSKLDSSKAQAASLKLKSTELTKKIDKQYALLTTNRSDNVWSGLKELHQQQIETLQARIAVLKEIVQIRNIVQSHNQPRVNSMIGEFSE